MNLFVVGLNHRTAPVQLRERLAVPARELPEAMRILRAASEVSEAVLLSTCNRVEAYVVSSQPTEAVSTALIDFLAFRSHLSPERFRSHLYQFSGGEAAQHLFRVAAGLDSMIVGESEITAQVKYAYLTAQTQGATGPLLNRLFQQALHATKVVRTRTHVAEGSASIGAIVVALAKQVIGERFAQAHVLLWGAGKAAEATTKHLVSAGIGQVWIVNRTDAKAKDLATLCQGQCLSWEQAIGHLAHVDIAVVCTQAPHYVIDRDDLAGILTQRAGRPLCLIDLAVPRNIDPLARHQPGVQLYNIDDLQTIAHEALAKRQQEVTQCDVLIEEQVHHFLRRQRAVRHEEASACSPVEAGLFVLD